MTARLRRFLAAFTGEVLSRRRFDDLDDEDRDPKGRGPEWQRGAADGLIELWAGVRKDRESTTDNRSEQEE